MSSARVVPLTPDHLEQAAALFRESYRSERAQSPLLPSRAIDEPEWIQGALQSRLGNPGVAVVEQGRLLGYMLTGDRFHWKGQQAAHIPEYGHSAIAEKRRELYQRMYMELSQEWVSAHIHLHLIGHFAHDAILQETLFFTGFGAILAERLRDVSPVDALPDLAIATEQDPGRLIDIQIEHNRYYPKAPIFITKPTERQEVLEELEEHAQQGDVFLVHYEQAEPQAYMILGRSAEGAEGFLLQQTNTAQIKSAYARPDARGKGVGAALLQRAIKWSHDQGYDRLFVEHETANVSGGNFWRRHFTPYVYFSMRYIDSAL